MSPPIDPLYFLAYNHEEELLCIFPEQLPARFYVGTTNKLGPTQQSHIKTCSYILCLLSLSFQYSLSTVPATLCFPHDHSILAFLRCRVKLPVLKKVAGCSQPTMNEKPEWQLAVSITVFAVPWSPKLDQEVHG